MRLFATCREVSGAIASGEYDTVAAPRRLWLLAHLLICDACRAFLAQLRHLGAVARVLDAQRLDPAAVSLFKKDLIGRLTH